MSQLSTNLTGPDDLNKILALLLNTAAPSGYGGGSAIASARQKVNLTNRVLYGNKQGMGLQRATDPNSYFATK